MKSEMGIERGPEENEAGGGGGGRKFIELLPKYLFILFLLIDGGVDPFSLAFFFFLSVQRP